MKNGKLKPTNVTPGSHKKVWWRCSKGHEWVTAVKKRCGVECCPYCAGRKVCEDNCLATVNPRIEEGCVPGDRVHFIVNEDMQ